MIAAIVCDRFGWTWEEYQGNPSWFNDIVWSMHRHEVLANRKQAKNGGG